MEFSIVFRSTSDFMPEEEKSGISHIGCFDFYNDIKSIGLEFNVVESTKRA